MTGRHQANARRGHEWWIPRVVRPSWPLELERSGAHRACPQQLSALATPGEATSKLRAFRRPR